MLKDLVDDFGCCVMCSRIVLVLSHHWNLLLLVTGASYFHRDWDVAMFYVVVGLCAVTEIAWLLERSGSMNWGLRLASCSESPVKLSHSQSTSSNCITTYHNYPSGSSIVRVHDAMMPHDGVWDTSLDQWFDDRSMMPFSCASTFLLRRRPWTILDWGDLLTWEPGRVIL
jgi:hypothetical protein